MTFAIRLIAAALLGTALAAPIRAESPAVKAMQDYMEFAPYEAGIIVPQQLAKDVFESVVFIDTRDNVLVLQTGIEGWRKDAIFKP